MLQLGCCRPAELYSSGAKGHRFCRQINAPVDVAAKRRIACRQCLAKTDDVTDTQVVERQRRSQHAVEAHLLELRFAAQDFEFATGKRIDRLAIANDVDRMDGKTLCSRVPLRGQRA